MLQAARQYEFDKLRENKYNEIKNVEISNNIVNGDCIDILKTLDDKCIDLVITDPPYGINYKSNALKYDNTITKRGLMNDGVEAFELLDKTCEVLQRKTADDSHLYFFCSWAVFSKF